MHTYRVHHDSHSRKKRTYIEAVKRIENFTKLRLELLKYCECDEQKYTKEIMRIKNSSMKGFLKTAARKARSNT